ncbi:uncharacterized protein A4U43_C05F34440 [Asparagus officinalis]|uniref:WAT1-related protein n=1 Tax=Asparagus officinalis TaxID=4686 RepID=A0A5P1F146_ASPOF|nr:uncharacterized protein A4U43_C05F34440 [Asparagus officinalis]
MYVRFVTLSIIIIFMEEEYKPVVAMVGLQLIYAGTALAAKAAFQEGMSPMVFVIYRQGIAALALAPPTILSSRRASQRTLGLKGFSLLFLTALIGVTISQFLYYQGLELSSASMATAITNIVPAFTFLMAASVGLEKVNIRSPRSMAKVLGTVICVGGAISMAFFKGPKLMNAYSQSTLISMLHLAGKNWKLGSLCLLTCSCCWSLWLILQVPLCTNYVDPLSLSSWMCLLSFLQSAILTYFLEPDFKAWKPNSGLQLLYCIYSGVAGSAVSFYLQSWCISRKGPLFSAMFSPLCTVIVTVIAVILFHERLYFGSLVGAIAVAVGLYVVLWGKAKDFDDNSRIPLTVDESSKTSEANLKQSLLDTKLQQDESFAV